MRKAKKKANININKSNKILIDLKQALEHTKTFTPKVPLALCGQLEDAIMLLEVRISNATAKINSLM